MRQEQMGAQKIGGQEERANIPQLVILPVPSKPIFVPGFIPLNIKVL